jgi:hypothetical protein
MVGATARRSALVVVVAVLALSFVADGVPGHVRPAHDPSGQVAAVQSGPLASIPSLRRQTSVADGRFRTDPAGGGRGAALLALVSVLCLLGLGSGTAHRAEHPTWAGCARRRHGISLRGPPLVA